MHRGRVVDKKRNKKGLKSFVGIGKYIGEYKLIILLALVFAVIGSTFAVLAPKILGEMANEFSIDPRNPRNINMEYIYKTGLLLVGLFFGSALLTYLCGFFMTAVTQKMAYKMREDISVKINKLPFSYFDKQSYGDVLSRVTNDVDTISENLNQGVTQIITSLARVIGILIMMFTIKWELALMALGTIPVSAILMGVVMAFSQKYFKQQQDSLGQLNGHIEEMYGGHIIIKSFNGEEISSNKFNKINSKLYKSAWKSQFLSGLMFPITGFIGNFGYILVIVFGFTMVLRGNMQFGEVFSVIIYFRQFTQPIGQIAQIANVFQGAAAASERVFEFLAVEEMENETNKKVLANVSGDVTFEKVRFGYSSEKMVIKDFTCNVKAGQKVAIVGPTGAGKTTIVNLLMRFYEINSGSILVDGINLKDLKRENVHALFGMVLQDTWLFEGTIKDNLKFGKPEATDEEMDSMTKAAHVYHYIKSLSKGYDTILDETANISSGQRQLLTIARAMLANAPMLILDEATSNVDTRTEILIQKAMEKLTEGRTSFVIAHRLSTIKDSDIILVMKDGNIVEQGKHEDLISNKGFYCDIYNSQFADSPCE